MRITAWIDAARASRICARRAARAAGLDHMACVQADVTDLPAEFTGAFDVV